jgi:glycosyltransferase involved in cell wall biosynthesis
MNVIFIQSRATKAGAQHALKRLISSELMRKHTVVVITSERGWLTEELEKFNHVKIIVEKFPSSRSLSAKLFKNRLWARKIINRLNNLNIYPHIIHANEYIENLFVYELSKYYKDCKSAVFLRSDLMTKKDFYKYKCNKNDIKIAVSDELKNKIGLYYEGIVNVVYDFLYEEEFFPPKKRSLYFPKKLLVIGNPHPNKGWDIAIESLNMFNKKYPNIINEIYFTGVPKNENYYKSIDGVKYIFKKYDILSIKAREFDLVISPSKYDRKKEREKFGIKENQIAIGILAVLRQFKRHDLFLKMAKEISKKYPKTIFLIAGDGPQKENIKKMIKELGLENKVKMIAHTKEPEKFLASIDILVLTSDSKEGVPQSVIQGLMMEKCVIASDVGSVKDLYDGKNFILIKPNDLNDLVKAVEKVIENKELRDKYSKNARKFVVENFSKNKMANKILKIYKNLLKV